MKKINEGLSVCLFISFLCALFVSFANVAMLTFNWHCVAVEDRPWQITCTVLRFFMYWVFEFCLLTFNNNHVKHRSIVNRIFPNVLFTMVGFAVFKYISHRIDSATDWYLIVQSLQFFVLGTIGFFLSYIEYLNVQRKKKEEELQMLKIETLQSRCSALTNQINPHFFFNSLNGISSLVRKKDDKLTIKYIDHLSDIFRYILQSEYKGLVTLEEELDFARSFSQVMQVRYAGKLDVDFDIPAECMSMQIPVLALLPLIENVSVHNIIDSEHVMKVHVYVNANKELVVSNPLYPKSYKPETHGTGLKNLEKRFALLMEKELRIETNDGKFEVIMPLR